MRAAGAIILGKTNIPVLSHTGSHANDSWAGPTYNAAGRALLPGGSSAGTATAVAASMAVLGLAGGDRWVHPEPGLRPGAGWREAEFRAGAQCRCDAALGQS